MKKFKFLIIVQCLIFSVFLLFASDFDSVTVKTADSLFAEEEFRRGVQSYYRGAFNEAIMLFENALSYLPSENLILDWLARSYYRAGLEGMALQHWQYAADAGYGGLLLQNKMEVIKERRVTEEQNISSTYYVEAGNYPGTYGEQFIFSQPSAILPNDDGTCWVLAYGSNELLCIDVNGFVAKRIRGPLNGFDRPMDIIRNKEGNLLISEYSGDRISVLDSDGNYIKSFGSKGVGQGQLVGPQYLALDSSENIYVTDFGNSRVVVFDKDGNPLLSFGKKTASFSGFSAPTGIAVYHDQVYVADAATGGVYSFDRAGNYTGILVPEGTFVRPESMKLFADSLIISDNNRICSINLATGAVFENGRTGSAPSRILSSVPDINGNILVSDFKANEVYVMSRMSELVGGLFVQVERVVVDNFPNITLELKVENRQRQPVVGLKAENFYITEGKIPVANQQLIGAAANNKVCDISIVIDRSVQTQSYSDAMEEAVKEIAQAMDGKGTLTVISSGQIPVIEYTGAPDMLGDFTKEALKVEVNSECSTDLAIRLAANGLINGEKKRAVVYLTGSDSVGKNSFSNYSLSQLSAYLNNNNIALYTINLSQNRLPEEISYITETTNGNVMYVYRPEGLADIVQDIISIPNGLYQLSYTSSLPTDFGRAYLPVEVEAYLLNRSGRDETGYYPPLE
ncbi:MAG: hypothetical protein J6B81_02665 [Spirochaetaceae bacterium]|nr:hypothetical protein [Spirochaetaceae bacterium]